MVGVKYVWHRVRRHNTLFLYNIAGMDQFHCVTCGTTHRRRMR